ncbi:hypothetical protein DMN91_004087 [Ooceraea biroi]|uniref:Uncharacterized protein n=1 Tax=Ooceraea biroi TaxID=2015173 RepID=A0A3L8DVC9_OOCBI|nr:hypothetical protein DMN91_004087 [Ooceraea biroi]
MSRHVWFGRQAATPACTMSPGERNPHEKGLERRRKSVAWKVVQTSHYDLRQLRNDCTYSANMRNMRECGGNDDHGISIEFFATGCRDDQK